MGRKPRGSEAAGAGGRGRGSFDGIDDGLSRKTKTRGISAFARADAAAAAIRGLAVRAIMTSREMTEI